MSEKKGNLRSSKGKDSGKKTRTECVKGVFCYFNLLSHPLRVKNLAYLWM